MNLVPIITELGIDKLTSEEQKPIFESIFRNLALRVGRRVGSELTEEELAHFDEMLKQGDYAAVTAEMERRHPGLERIYQEELEAIKENIKAILPQ